MWCKLINGKYTIKKNIPDEWLIDVDGITYPTNIKSKPYELKAIGIFPFRKENIPNNRKEIGYEDILEGGEVVRKYVTEDKQVIQADIDTHIARIKQAAFGLLAATDWYVTRKLETDTPIPQAVIDYRGAVRTESDRLETLINAAVVFEDLYPPENWPVLEV